MDSFPQLQHETQRKSIYSDSKNFFSKWFFFMNK